jgi:tetratricopeptide (TPR) repeat protein
MRPEGKEASSLSRRRLPPLGVAGLLAASAFLTAGTGAALALEGAADKAIVKSQEGGSALLRGRYDLAVAAYDDALKDSSLLPARQAALYTDRGVAKWRLKQMDGAIADFTKAVSLNPDYASAYNNRGNVYLDMNRAEDASKDFDRAIALAPDFGAAYSNRANVNQKLKRIEAAEKDFRRAIALLPGSAVPLNGRGKIATSAGQYYTALRYLNRAISLNAQYASAYQNRAAVFSALKRNDEAAQDLDKVIALSPDNASLYVVRGQAYARDKKWMPAFRDFTKALELAPDNVAALVGRASQNLERRRDLALEDLNKAIGLDPNASEAYFWRGQAKYAANDVEGADADLSKAVELDPSFSEASRFRGWYRERAGKREEAIADYRRALEIDPFSKEARDAYKAASGDTADSVVKPLSPAVDGWEVFRSAPGQYTAINERFAKLPVILELQGAGPAEIVEWTPLKDTLSGIGLLRYRSGDKKFEYVAIIDLSRGQVVGVEPYIVGDAKSKWVWTQNAVTVTDIDGLASYYELRRPETRPTARRDDNGYFGGGRRRWGGGGGGFFGWMFQ